MAVEDSTCTKDLATEVIKYRVMMARNDVESIGSRTLATALIAVYLDLERVSRRVDGERMERVRLAQLFLRFLTSDRTENWNLTYAEMEVLESLAQVPIS
jgi:hypothetical protein